MAPSVLRGPLKALRYETEGVKDKTGIVVQDEVDAAALWGQAAGFSPSTVRNAYEGKAAIVGHDPGAAGATQCIGGAVRHGGHGWGRRWQSRSARSYCQIQREEPRAAHPAHAAGAECAPAKRIREAQEGVYLPVKRRDALEQGRFAVGE